jgi:CRP-like cAMP-binding protein
VRLLELDSDLVRFVAPEERAVLAPLSLPVVDVSSTSVALAELLEANGAFGAIVLDGILLKYLQIGSQRGLRLLGPGDVLGSSDAPPSARFNDSVCRAGTSTQLALLGSDFLLAVRRTPRVLLGLQAGIADQIDRQSAQLVICQLSRVEDRVLAMLWLLAESFGRVTPGGTIVPLVLTHQLLGSLVGARRPTVTLAVGALVQVGALVHKDGGWLLLKAIPERDPQLLQGFDELRILAHQP